MQTQNKSRMSTNAKVGIIGAIGTVLLLGVLLWQAYEQGTLTIGKFHFGPHPASTATVTPVPPVSVDSKTKTQIDGFVTKMNELLESGDAHSNFDVIDQKLESQGLVTPYFVTQQKNLNQQWLQDIRNGVTKVTDSDFHVLSVTGTATSKIVLTTETESVTQNGKVTAYPYQQLSWQIVIGNNGKWQVNAVNAVGQTN